MADIEKVIKGLESCIGHCALMDCPYFDEKCETIGCNGNQVMKDALELLKEYKRQDGCPCTHCMEWECDEVCEEYKKWKDS